MSKKYYMHQGSEIALLEHHKYSDIFTQKFLCELKQYSVKVLEHL